MMITGFYAGVGKKSLKYHFIPYRNISFKFLKLIKYVKTDIFRYRGPQQDEEGC